MVKEKILNARNVTKRFGGLVAVNNVSLYVARNELVALIGPNGAGKTTMFNLLTGISPATSGTITLKKNGHSVDISHMKTYKIAQKGISRTFQNIRIFPQMTVKENILISLTNQYREGIVATICHTPRFYRHEQKMLAKVNQLLADFDLDLVADSLAGSLPYGQQRRLEIVRALATKPKLLCLDEPAAGMNPEETAALTQLIHRLQADYKVAILLIEHDMSLVMDLAERIYVLNQGEVLATGTPAEIKRNPDVIAAYLGGE